MTPDPKVPWSKVSRKLLNFGEPYANLKKSSEEQSEQEEKDATISVRKHSEGDQGTMSVEAFSQMIKKVINQEIKEFNVE